MFTLPAPTKLLRPLLSIGARNCPFSIQRAVADQILPRAFREALEDGDLDFLEGRIIGLRVTDLDYQSALTLKQGALQLLDNHSSAEVTISGELEEFIRMATRKEDPDTLFFQRRLSIEGDTELGLEVKNLIDSIDTSTLPRWMQQGLSLAGRMVH